MVYIPKKVKLWRYGMWGEMEEYWTREDQAYGPLMDELLTLLYNL